MFVFDSTSAFFFDLRIFKSLILLHFVSVISQNNKLSTLPCLSNNIT